MPDIKTAMQQALQGTKLQPSVKSLHERVWQFVKDRPGLSAKRIQAELQIPSGSVTRVLWEFTQVGLMRTESRTKFPDGKGHKHLVYFTTLDKYYKPDLPKQVNKTVNPKAPSKPKTVTPAATAKTPAAASGADGSTVFGGVSSTVEQIPQPTPPSALLTQLSAADVPEFVQNLPFGTALALFKCLKRQLKEAKNAY